MENSLKQRIIGALVLAALAVIFLPSILKEKTEQGEFVSQIPEKPEELENYQLDTRKIEDLIEEASQKNQQLEQKIAEKTSKPDVEPLANDTQQTEAEKANTDNSESKESPNLSSAKDIQKETIAENFADAAWIIQVASFSKEQNAKNMVSTLKKEQFKAYYRNVKANNREVYRVFVGPYIEKEKAQGVISKISQFSQSKAILKPFDPINH